MVSAPFHRCCRFLSSQYNTRRMIVRNKRVIAAGCAAVMTMTMASQALAGEWKQNETGWWRQEEDGSYPADTWKWLGGNGDGISECYSNLPIEVVLTHGHPDYFEVIEIPGHTNGSIALLDRSRKTLISRDSVQASAEGFLNHGT